MKRSVGKSNPQTRMPKDKVTRKWWSQFTKKLLAIDGQEVIWLEREPHLIHLLSNGQLCEQAVRIQRGRRNACHYNAARLWAKDVTNTQLVTGYGFRRADGLWRQHSWIVKGDKLIETTVRFDNYYGVVLKPLEALEFWVTNYASEEYPDGICGEKSMEALSPELLSLMAEQVRMGTGATVVTPDSRANAGCVRCLPKKDEEDRPMPPKHKTVKVSRGEIDVDEKLAPLIPLLWAKGIETFQCCQETRPGEAYIEFSSSGEVMEFLDVAQQPYRVEVETWDEGTNGHLSIAVRLLVFFPTKDIPKLIKKFRKRPGSKLKDV